MTDLERNLICKAIVTIHGLVDYYGGMDILCDLVGWGSLKNDLYPDKQMANWVLSNLPDSKKDRGADGTKRIFSQKPR